MNKKGSSRLTLGVCFVIALVYFGGIWHRPLFSPEEISHALTAREMLLSGNFSLPTLNGLPCTGNLAPFYWLSAAAVKIFGENTFALRFPSALFTLLSAAAVYFFCRWNGEKRLARTAALLYLCCGTVFAGASWGVPAPVPAFFTVVSGMAGFFYYTGSTAEKRWLSLIGGGILAGLGALSGGPVVLLSAATLFVLFGLVRKTYAPCLAGVFPLLGVMGIVFLPGVVFLYRAMPELRQFYLQDLPYSLSGVNLLFAVAGTFPVLLLLPGGIAAVRYKGKAFFYRSDERLFSLLAVLVLTILFILAGNDSIALALPVFPFFAILSAELLLEAEKAQNIALSGKILHIFCIVLGCATLFFIVWHLLPAVPFRWKFYSSRNIIPVVMVSGLLLLWYGMAAKEKDIYPGRKFLYFCIGTGVFFVSFSHLIPFKVQRQYDKNELIRRAVLPHLRSGAELFADGETAVDAAWSMHRNAGICFTPGPFKHVLARSGKQVISSGELSQKIRSAVRKGQQAVIFTRTREFLPELPLYRTTVRSGQMTIVIYGDLLK